MLNDKLVKFCENNFDDGKLILTKLYEYKKILIKENENLNLIGKSTLIDLDERHLLDCIQIVKYLPQHEKSIMDIGTGAAVKEAGMHEKVFLVTSGGGGKTGCDNLKNDIFDVFVSYDVPGQARDLSNVVKSLLQSGNKPGKAGKVSLFTQLQTLTKDNMASYMGSGACWTVESLASN